MSMVGDSLCIIYINDARSKIFSGPLSTIIRLVRKMYIILFIIHNIIRLY